MAQRSSKLGVPLKPPKRTNPHKDRPMWVRAGALPENWAKISRARSSVVTSFLELAPKAPRNERRRFLPWHVLIHLSSSLSGLSSNSPAKSLTLVD